MMHCLDAGKSENAEMSVLERQRFRLKCHQEQLIHNLPVAYFNEEFGGGDQGLCDLVNGAMKPDPGLENGLNYDFRTFLGSEFELSYAVPGTASCPMNAAPDVGMEAATMISAGAGNHNSKKRKADKTKAIITEEKKMKGCAEDDSKITEQNSNNKSTTTTTTTTTTTSATTSTAANTKTNAKEAPKTEYIHVRARRGQATDSHSLAERVRREKISERMKYLQDLVPGCNKITGKAGMLDEIINYVQSLQRQVEFLSMKLAAINPRLDFDVENYLLKEIIPTMGGASSSDQFNVQLNSALGLGQSTSNLAMDMTLRRTTTAPLSIPHNFLDSSTLNQIQHFTWEEELQNLYNMEYQQGRSTTFISQPFTGFQEEGHVKLEM